MEAYERIDLDDYIQTGEGGTALTYNHKDGKALAKLFMPGMGAETAEREFKVNRIVYDMGLPTPKPIRLVTDGKRNLWIDVGDFSYGRPEWDLCMMFYMSEHMSAERADNIFHLTPEMLKKHWELFAPAYYGTADSAELGRKQQVLYPFFALKMLFAIGKMGNSMGVDLSGVFGLVRKILG